MYLKEIRPFACVRLNAADMVEVDVGEQWRLMVRAFTRLTPLIEEHRASRALILALGGSERLLLRGTTPDGDAIERVWPLLANAITQLLTEAVPSQGAGQSVGMVGIGPTRTVAWLASILSSTGAAVVLPGQERTFLASLPVALLQRTPDATAIDSLASIVAALETSGIRTLSQLWRLPIEALSCRFGADGSLLAALATGSDLRSLRRVEDSQWLGARLHFEPPLAAQYLATALVPLVERLALTLTERELAVGKVALLVESETGARAQVLRRLTHPLGTTRALLEVATRLLTGVLADAAPNSEADTLPDARLPGEGERYVALRLRVGGLHPATAEQRRLWVADQQQAGFERVERLAAALRALRGGKYADDLLQADQHAPDAVLPEERYRMTPRST
jgi:hypothetical protein